MRDHRQQHARVVGAAASDLQDPRAAGARRVHVGVGSGLDVEADAVAGAEDVRGRAELDVVLADLVNDLSPRCRRLKRVDGSGQRRSPRTSTSPRS